MQLLEKMIFKFSVLIGRFLECFPGIFSFFSISITKIFIFSVILGTFLPISAQNKTCYKVRDKKAIKLYEHALEQADYRPQLCKDLLYKAIQIDKKYVEAWFLMGTLDYKNAKKNELSEEMQKAQEFYDEAIKDFQKVQDLCPQFNSYYTFFYIGEYFYKKRNFEQSQHQLNTFLKNNQKTSEEDQARAKKYLRSIKTYYDLKNNPVPFEPHSVIGICTEDDEYLPYISPDGEIMYYTHRYIRTNGNRNEEKSVEEFVYSTKLNKTENQVDTFTEAKLMVYPFNDGRDQGGVTLTIDNKHLFLTLCETVRMDITSYKNCDIFTSDLVEGKWTPLRNIGNAVNSSSSFEGQPTVSSDGRKLYFASAREGGFGGLDIYVAVRDPEGKWSKPVNLGPIINTPGDDKTPFIHPDGQTLYFSSDGHIGIGGLDIFYSKVDTIGGWTEPVNIGYPINTEKDEFGFIVSTSGKKFYFSSNVLKEGYGGYDIYTADLYKNAQPRKVLFVKGKLLDEGGKAITDATIELKSMLTHKITKGFVDNETGKYAVAVHVKSNEEFVLSAKKKGYLYSTYYINPNTDTFVVPEVIDLTIKKPEEGTVFQLNNINFATNSADLKSSSKISLDYLAEFLNNNLGINLLIFGHTDDVGTPEQNMELSVSRAFTVKKYLVSKGVREERLTYSGFGETNPINNNESSEGRAQNRRTEFLILKSPNKK